MREAKYLTYLGNRKEGILLVRHAQAWSEWRNFPYYTGMRLRLDFDIPSEVAGWIVDENKTLFRIETKELSAEDSFKEQFRLLLDNYIEDLDPNVMLDLIGVCIAEDSDGLPDITVEPIKLKEKKPKKTVKTKVKRVRRVARSS
jgi:hypothetical protein